MALEKKIGGIPEEGMGEERGGVTSKTISTSLRMDLEDLISRIPEQEIGKERTEVISEKPAISAGIAGVSSGLDEERSGLILEKAIISDVSAEIVGEKRIGETPEEGIGEERSEVISERHIIAEEKVIEEVEEGIKAIESELPGPTIPESLKGSIKTAEVSEKVSFVGKTAQQALTDQKRDCGCQAIPQAEQSCQCCECKDVGVSTSRDSETLTDENMVRPSAIEPLEQIPEISENEQLSTTPAEGSRISRDFAEAVDVESGQIQG